jgi:hypothetical protein
LGIVKWKKERLREAGKLVGFIIQPFQVKIRN